MICLILNVSFSNYYYSSKNDIKLFQESRIENPTEGLLFTAKKRKLVHLMVNDAWDLS